MEKTIAAERLLLRPFRGSDLPDLSEFLSQLEDDESEGYPDFAPERGWSSRCFGRAPRNTTPWN